MNPPPPAPSSFAARRAAGWLAAFALLLALPRLAANEYQVYLLNIICVNVLLCVGLNIVKGFAGQVTVGHIGLYAIGAYSSALLALNLGLPFWLTLPAAMVITMLAGVVVGIPSFRLEGAYLALATLGLGETVRITITVTESLGSTQGIGGIPSPVFFGRELDTATEYYHIALPLTLVGIYLSFSILRSSTGRAFKAVREDPLAAAAAGVPVRRCKLLAFVLSAAYAGCAGALKAHLAPGYIHPNNFTIIEMVTLLLMVVLGGIGNIWGGVIGAVIVTILYDLTREYYQYQLLIFGMTIVLTVLFMPKGIGGVVSRRLAVAKFVRARGGHAA